MTDSLIYSTTEHGDTEGSNSSWAFTINNPTEQDLCYINALANISTRLFVSHETGKQGTPHYQGYVTFRGGKRFKAVKDLLPRAYLGKARKNYKANRSYVFKEGSDVIVDLNNSNQGERTDLDDAREVIKSSGYHNALKRCAEECGTTYVKYARGLRDYRQQIYQGDQTPREFQPIIIWVYGPAGSGKTRMPNDMYPSDQRYTVRDPKWWSGYRNQPVAILDELRSDKYDYDTLLKLTDRYPYDVQIKGGEVTFNSKVIWVTGPQDPDYTYMGKTNDHNTIKQLQRRITLLIHLTFDNPTYYKFSQDGSFKHEIPEPEAQAILAQASQAEVQADAKEPERGTEMASEDSPED